MSKLYLSTAWEALVGIVYVEASFGSAEAIGPVCVDFHEALAQHKPNDSVWKAGSILICKPWPPCEQLG